MDINVKWNIRANLFNYTYLHNLYYISGLIFLLGVKSQGHIQENLSQEVFIFHL